MADTHWVGARQKTEKSVSIAMRPFFYRRMANWSEAMQNEKKNKAVVNQTEPAFLRPPEAARCLSISKRHLKDLTDKGIIPGCKVGRKLMLYSRQELIKAILKFQSGKVV